MPSTGAPILVSRRARSWTCGSEAALEIVVVARGQRGGHQRVLGAHHRGLVHEDLAGAEAAGGAVSSIQRSPPTRAPRSRKASRWASRRRRPMKSPPGGGMLGLAEAGQQRAGEQERGADRGARAPRRASVSVTFCGAEPDAVVGDPLDLDPELLAAARSGPRCRGSAARWCSTTSSSVSRQAARIGRAAFLLPAAVISPESGTPPWMTNFSISCG